MGLGKLAYLMGLQQAEEMEGEPIAGSRWYRHYCCRCGCPMRVTKQRLDTGLECEECDPMRGRTRDASWMPQPIDDPSNSFMNVERAYEDCG